MRLYGPAKKNPLACKIRSACIVLSEVPEGVRINLLQLALKEQLPTTSINSTTAAESVELLRKLASSSTTLDLSLYEALSLSDKLRQTVVLC